MNKNLLESLNDVKFIYRDKLNFEKKYKFGIEIEFEKANFYCVEKSLIHNRNLKKWDLHYEPTIQSDNVSLGGEVVSPILHNTKREWQKVKKACLMLKEMGAVAEEYSGAHIHIDQNILCDEKKYILNLLKIWVVYEHVINQFSYGENSIGRKNIRFYAYSMSNLFIKFIRNYNISSGVNIYEGVMLFCDTYYPSLKGGLWFADCHGAPGAENNTIEIRCPNGTLNETIWQNNVNFFINLLKYCTGDFDEELIDYKLDKYQDIYNYNSHRYLADAEEIASMIFNDDTDKIYFLKQYTKCI